MSGLEVGANAVNALSIFLAGRNSVHTWWTGIVGCVLYGVMFFQTRLYADVTLQVFFAGTSVAGWWAWTHFPHRKERPVTRIGLEATARWALVGVAVTLGYGWLLHRFTDAYAPYLDSVVLAFSVLGQLLLLGRRLESWWCWIGVNTLAVPLYASRGLYVTSALYALFWINALVSLRTWRRLVEP